MQRMKRDARRRQKFLEERRTRASVGDGVRNGSLAYGYGDGEGDGMYDSYCGIQGYSREDSSKRTRSADGDVTRGAKRNAAHGIFAGDASSGGRMAGKGSDREDVETDSGAKNGNGEMQGQNGANKESSLVSEGKVCTFGACTHAHMNA